MRAGSANGGASVAGPTQQPGSADVPPEGAAAGEDAAADALVTAALAAALQGGYEGESHVPKLNEGACPQVR